MFLKNSNIIRFFINKYLDNMLSDIILCNFS